ncbi:MAG: ribonuclease HI [Acidobacteriota bacterium]|nr:ribonuclease HI [Acidobacteriota bacterium]
MSDLKQVVIYTDGACSGNPGPGGYGAVLLFNGNRKELSGGFRLTTNNRMEMLAAIEALRSLEDRCAVKLHSDSQYVINAIKLGWAARWQANGWMRNKKDKAVNPDLWMQMLDLCKQHQVELIWVRGHSGNVENERCDQLAAAAAQQRDLPADEIYECLVR